MTFQEQPAAPRRTRVLPPAPGSARIVSASRGGRPEQGPAPHHPRLLTAPGPGGRAALAHDAGELLLPCLPDSPEGHQVGGTHRRKLRRRHCPGGQHGAWNVPWDRQRASSPSLAGWWLGARLRLPCPPSGGLLPIYPWTARQDFLIQLWILQKCFEKNKTLEKRVVSRWLQFGSPNQTSVKAFRRLSNVPLSLPQVASRWPAPSQVEGRLPLPGHLPMGTPVP